MNDKKLGDVPCPVCRLSAPVKETKKGKAYVTCGECGLQVFARGVESDRLLRKQAGAGASAARPAVAAKSDSQPAAIQQAAQPAQAAATVRTHSSETQRTEEKTIFDVLTIWAGK